MSKYYNSSQYTFINLIYTYTYTLSSKIFHKYLLKASEYIPFDRDLYTKINSMSPPRSLRPDIKATDSSSNHINSCHDLGSSINLSQYSCTTQNYLFRRKYSNPGSLLIYQTYRRILGCSSPTTNNKQT